MAKEVIFEAECPKCGEDIDFCEIGYKNCSCGIIAELYFNVNFEEIEEKEDEG